jgi:glutamate dehydrogenase/leucine dehydrogenase
LETGGKLASIPKEIVEFIREPTTVYKFAIPIKREDGTWTVYQAYRSQHKSLRMPMRGGVMYHSQVNYDSMKALSLINTIKYNVMDLPLGGSKGGISCDPKTLTNFELERITRKYAIELAKQQMIGAAVDFYVNLTLKINSPVNRYRKWRTGNQLDKRYLSKFIRSGRSQLPRLL